MNYAVSIILGLGQMLAFWLVYRALPTHPPRLWIVPLSVFVVAAMAGPPVLQLRIWGYADFDAALADPVAAVILLAGPLASFVAIYRVRMPRFRALMENGDQG